MTRPRQGAVLRPVSLAAIPTLLLAPGLVLGPTLDAAVFLLVGARIRDGGMPYRDIWDHKPPGVYLLHAASETVLPFADRWLLAWLLSAVFTVASVLLLDVVLRRHTTPLWSWLWSAAAGVLVSAYSVSMGGGLTETFALLPITAALVLVDAPAPGVRRAAAVGLVSGAACLFSMLAVPAAVALALAVVWQGGGTWAARGRAFAAVVAGALPIPLLVLAWLAAGGAVPAALDQLLTYNQAYRATSTQLWRTLLEPLGVLAFTLVAAATGVGRWRGWRTAGATAWAGIAWAAGFAVFVAYDGRVYPHYLILVVPPLCLLGAIGSGRLVASSEGEASVPRLRAGIVFADLVLFVAASALLLGSFSVSRASGQAEWRSTADRLSAQVRAFVPEGGSVFVWGDSPDLYLLATRMPATPYVYQLPTVTPGYWTPARTAELLAAWRVAPPAAIVESPNGVPLWVPPGWRPPAGGDARTYDGLDPLREFVRDRYRRAADVDGLEVWVLAAPGA